MSQDNLEPQPLLPLSGHVPIAINSQNREHLKLEAHKKELMQARIEQDSIPWTSILLVPFVGILLLLIVSKIKGRT